MVSTWALSAPLSTVQNQTRANRSVTIVTQAFFCFKLFIFFADFLDGFAAVLVLTIITVVIYSSLYDSKLKENSEDLANHNAKDSELKLNQVMAIFSINRNWKTLMAPTRPDVKDLRFIEFIRTFGLFGTIHSHCIMTGLVIPSANPIFIDKVRERFPIHWFLLSFSQIQECQHFKNLLVYYFDWWCFWHSNFSRHRWIFDGFFSNETLREGQWFELESILERNPWQIHSTYSCYGAGRLDSLNLVIPNWQRAVLGSTDFHR